MLAYVFWHRPQDDDDAEGYEQLVCAFHRSLARSLPAGMLASASYRVAELPWFEAPAYEDWYLLEDYAALGVLNEAAVGRGHRSSHDRAARRSGSGAGALYALLEGEPGAQALADATLAVWVQRPPSSPADALRSELAELLGDGLQPRRGSVWRRQLVLGPAPEYCVLAAEPPSGVAPTRLPEGWTASILARDLLCGG